MTDKRCDACRQSYVLRFPNKLIDEYCQHTSEKPKVYEHDMLAAQDREIESLKEKFIESQAREMQLRKFIKLFEWELRSDISDIKNIKQAYICPVCFWKKENGHDPRCDSKVKNILEQPAPPIAEVLKKVERILESELPKPGKVFEINDLKNPDADMLQHLREKVSAVLVDLKKLRC